MEEWRAEKGIFDLDYMPIVTETVHVDEKSKKSASRKVLRSYFSYF